MKLIIIMALIFCYNITHAQTDTIFTKGNQQILCSHIKETTEQYNFYFKDAENKNSKSCILKYLVDSINHFVPPIDTNNIARRKTKIKKEAPFVINNPNEKAWHHTVSLGINLGSVLEFNNIGSSDKKTLSANANIDLGLNYKKHGKKFEMTNELHYLFGIQKEGLSSSAHIQSVQDNVNMLHDISLGIGKKNKWNYNTIIKSSTSFFTVYNTNYFKDFAVLGAIKGFASPYDISVAPGIKYQPNPYFRLSMSPYSFDFYGVQNKSITAKGIFITEKDAHGIYKNFLFKRLGAQINFWYDRQIKQWLTMQYRLEFSSDYFENFGKNGLMDGLFITRIKVAKNIYLTHNITVKSNLATNFLKPYFNQTILISYSKSF